MTDADIPKEAKPSFYLKNITPILLKNGVVHFLGFGNRLAFDPIPFQLQVQNKLLTVFKGSVTNYVEFSYYSSPSPS